MAKYSDRIRKMAEFVPVGGTLADIGSDHAYLPIMLYREERCDSYILTDVRPGPLERARESVTGACGGLPDCFELRLGDGLFPLKPGEVDTCVIAGMGGESIAAILGREPGIAMSIGRFILQPRTKGEFLMSYLTGQGLYRIIERAYPVERGRRCEVIICEPVVLYSN